jgi:cephalosporin-C deacetylase-like acetyl esterase
MKKLFLSAAVFLFAVALFAGEYSLRNVRLSKANGIYNVGEELICRARLYEKKDPVRRGVTLRCVVKFEGNVVDTQDIVCNGNVVEFRYKPEKPGWVYLGFQVVKDGNVVKNPGFSNPQGKADYLAEVGALFSPEKLKIGNKRPDDFEEFWAKQRAELDKVPVTELKKTKLDSGDPKVELYAVEVACSTKRPVTGYLAIPRGAKPKSLPIMVWYLSWWFGDASRAEAIAAAREGAIGFAATWHGLPVNQNQSVYNAAKSEPEYEVSTGINDPNTWSYKDVYIRVLRALDYVKSLPEWNGKDLAVQGGSLGGLEATVAAALDPQVTIALIEVCAFCDYDSVSEGRKRGIPLHSGTPLVAVKAMVYYDAVHFAPMIKADCYFCTGLADELCPPSSVYALYNLLPKTTKKQMYVNPRTGHGGTTPNPPGKNALKKLYREKGRKAR